ncbi:MAG: hypothetical protein QOF34_713, partial [Sphingomonadales bacterium]|nr:hypothetical protein [Sphingomonadales bacterium]
MSVVEFPRHDPLSGAWSPDELQQLIALFRADGTSYAVGATERGEPQFYLLGPAPEHDCVLCVSRLAQGYVLQDGAGRLIGEAPSLDRFAVEAARAAIGGGRAFVARVTLLVGAIRLTIEEKVEPIFEETQELLARFAPQVA